MYGYKRNEKRKYSLLLLLKIKNKNSIFTL